MIDEDFSLASPVSVMHFFNFDRWNVRFPGDAGATFMLQLPQFWYAIFQTAITLLLFFGVIYICKIIRKTRFSLRGINLQDSIAMLGIFLLLMFCLPYSGQVFFWKTGSSNYLYPLVLFIWYAVPILKLIIGGKDPFHKISNKCMRAALITGYVIAGFFLGMGFENLSPIMFIYIIATITYLKFSKIKIPIWVLLSAITVCLGLFVLFFSHGTQTRIEYYKDIFQNHSSYLTNFLHNIVPVIKSFFHQIALPLVIWALLLCGVGKKYHRKNIVVQLLCLAVGLLSICIMSVGVYIEQRAYFFAVFFTFIPVIFAARSLPEKSQFALGLATGIIILSIMPTILHEITNRHQFFQNREAWIVEVKQAYEDYRNGLTDKVFIRPDFVMEYQSKLTYSGVEGDSAERLNDFLQVDKSEIEVSLYLSETH
jgi:hypothetical protein